MKNSLYDLNLKNLDMYTKTKISAVINQNLSVQKLPLEVQLISQVEFESFHWSKQSFLISEMPLVIVNSYSPLQISIMASEDTYIWRVSNSNSVLASTFIAGNQFDCFGLTDVNLSLKGMLYTFIFNKEHRENSGLDWLLKKTKAKINQVYFELNFLTDVAYN